MKYSKHLTPYSIGLRSTQRMKNKQWLKVYFCKIPLMPWLMTVLVADWEFIFLIWVHKKWCWTFLLEIWLNTSYIWLNTVPLKKQLYCMNCKWQLLLSYWYCNFYRANQHKHCCYILTEPAHTTSPLSKKLCTKTWPTGIHW